MKKILITGISGFVGYHLSEYLKEIGEYQIFGTKLDFEKCSLDDVKIYDMDLTNKDSVEEVIKDVNPEYVIHLAAQSSVKLSWDNPTKTVDINIIGTINLLNAIKSNNIKTKVLLVGSSEEYGNTFKNIESPDESCKCVPENIYALTKNTQNQLGYLYSKAYGMNIVMTRSFNHFGIKQSEIFVISDFCKQVAEIENDLREPVIHVGNLDAKRDFLNVRDVVRAYVLLVEKGRTSETYNIGSGNSYRIGDILNKIISFSSVEIKVEIDKAKYRALDIEKTVADISKLKGELNWQPQEDFDTGLKNVLDYWRKKVVDSL